MATTMALIAKQTVGANGASTVIFSNIPQAYTDIKVVYSARCSDTTNNWNVLTGYFNADSTSGNYPGSTTYAFSSATGATTVNKWFGYLPNASGWFGGAFGNGEFYVPNYSVNGVAKTVNVESAAEGNSTTLVPMQLTVTRWTGTAPITTITLSCDTGNFLENSTFYLYGVSNSSTQNTSVPYASGGDVITTDGSYWYHTFLYSGTFTPLKELTCDYLVVAGGGGGGATAGGGGGAGGYRTSIGGTPLSLTAQAYTATIGAGGAASTNGGNSVFDSITSAGGGGGQSVAVGNSGGSGGGGGGNDNATYAGGSGNTPSTSPSQGNNGGTGFGQPGDRNGGGGGGSSAAGGNYSNGVSGNGGNGTANSISGTSITYAGGGGGGNSTGTPGTGGTGGGGNGSQSAGTPTAGTANRGGGGGGGNAGATGGSGIIVLRYAV